MQGSIDKGVPGFAKITEETIVVNKEKGEGRVGRDEVRKVPGTRSHQVL